MSKTYTVQDEIAERIKTIEKNIEHQRRLRYTAEQEIESANTVIETYEGLIAGYRALVPDLDEASSEPAGLWA